MESEEVQEIQVLKRPTGDNIKLPEKYDLLLQFVHQIDQAWNMLQIRQHTPTFTNIKTMVEHQTKRQFNMTHFQQILSINPNLYNHKWEMKHGKMELMIILPKNADQLAAGQEIEASDHSFYGKISERTMHIREKSVK